MSRFHGKQRKGAMRGVKFRKFIEALERDEKCPPERRRQYRLMNALRFNDSEMDDGL